MTESTKKALEIVRQDLEPGLGASAARRVRSFRNGQLYVESTIRAAVAAWLIDSGIVNGTAVGLGLIYYGSSTALDRGAGTTVIVLALIVLLPFVYGWCYGGGRALGGALAGTRSVRIADGGRIGLWRAGWAMLVRTLFLPFFFWVALSGTDLGEVRVSIDETATRRLRALERGAPGGSGSRGAA